MCVLDGFPHWTDQQLDHRVYVAMPAGKELVLRCPAAGAPSPNITWMKDGRRFEKRLVGLVSFHFTSLYRLCKLMFVIDSCDLREL